MHHTTVVSNNSKWVLVLLFVATFVVVNFQLLQVSEGFAASPSAILEAVSAASALGLNVTTTATSNETGAPTIDSNMTTTTPARSTTTTAAMKIVILTMDRFHSLTRLVRSLEASDYLGDKVDLVIRFDLPKNPTDEWRSRVQGFHSSLLGDNNNAIAWSAGNVSLSIAEQNMGLRRAWLSAWRPSSAEDRAIIFEDDIEVSPLWYKWIKGAYANYGSRHDVAGISLQRQTLVPLKTSRGNAIDDNGGKPFLYKLVGSIGYAPIASQWLEFLDFAECALATDMSVATPELVTSDWYDSLDKRSMWTQLFIYFCKNRNLYTLYAFPSQKLTLAAHWREKGEHYGATEGRDFQLVAGSSSSSSWTIEYPPDVPKLEWDARTSPAEPKLRSLVLTAAVGYQKGEFERFVSNLREHYHGDVAVLVWQQAPREIFELLEKNGFQVVPTPEAGGPRGSLAWYRVNTVRWQFYQDACLESKYDLCMAVDFRDTLFQDDPFRNMKGGTSNEAVLHVFEHNLVMNEWHINEAFKCKQRNQELRGKQIINAGGFIGSPKAFPLLARWIGQDAKQCDDQVALNLGVYGNLLNVTVVSHRQGDGSINNVAWGGAFRKDSRQRFLNHNCFPAPAVHQFDIVGVHL